ncbi:MAG: SRPBCC family protein [Geminicoccaceae bacterium]
MPKAYASTVIDRPAGEVWAVIRDFNGLPDWNPGVTRSMIEDGRPADQVGCVRSFYLADGAHLRERLLAFSDPEMSMTYNFEKTPFAVENYIATLRCTTVTDGHRCFVEWWTDFDCDLAKRAEWLDFFAGSVFQGGFDGLKERLRG